MNLVRILALLISALSFIAVLHPNNGDPILTESGIGIIIGGIFFALMAVLSFLNKGAVDSPLVYFSFSAVFLFYSSIGIISGAYPWKRYSFSRLDEPEIYWAILCFSLFSGIGLFWYGYTLLKVSKSLTLRSSGTPQKRGAP